LYLVQLIVGLRQRRQCFAIFLLPIGIGVDPLRERRFLLRFWSTTPRVRNAVTEPSKSFSVFEMSKMRLCNLILQCAIGFAFFLQRLHLRAHGIDEQRHETSWLYAIE
jgi:hypothetical protein